MIRFVSQPSETPRSPVVTPHSPSRELARAAPLIHRPRDSQLPYLDGLNDEQRRGVEALDGPVLILAGAGVGKTRVLTTRIAHIVSTGRARAHEILAVTFTNKAAREMRQRVAVFAGSEQAMPWLGTFHSVGAKILRMHAELVGLRPNFTILDSDDQLRLLKQLLQAENLDDKRWPARALANLIDGWKNRGIDPKSVSPSEASGFAAGKGAVLYENYQARLKSLNAVDFGDLLLEPLRLLRENSDFSACSGGASVTFWSTSTRTRTSFSIFFSGCSPRPTAICAASATTISRSTPGAARMSKTSCGSRRIFLARR